MKYFPTFSFRVIAENWGDDVTEMTLKYVFVTAKLLFSSLTNIQLTLTKYQLKLNLRGSQIYETPQIIISKTVNHLKHYLTHIPTQIGVKISYDHRKTVINDLLQDKNIYT